MQSALRHADTIWDPTKLTPRMARQLGDEIFVDAAS